MSGWRRAKTVDWTLVPVGSRWFPLVPVGLRIIGPRIIGSRIIGSRIIGSPAASCLGSCAARVKFFLKGGNAFQQSLLVGCVLLKRWQQFSAFLVSCLTVLCSHAFVFPTETRSTTTNGLMTELITELMTEVIPMLLHRLPISMCAFELRTLSPTPNRDWAL